METKLPLDEQRVVLRIFHYQYRPLLLESGWPSVFHNRAIHLRGGISNGDRTPLPGVKGDYVAGAVGLSHPSGPAVAEAAMAGGLAFSPFFSPHFVVHFVEFWENLTKWETK